MEKQGIVKYNLIVVAHPDDESIFFSGLIQRKSKLPWRIICLTDGNADGNGEKRKRDFIRACKALKVKDIEWWGYPDKYNSRLPVDEICTYLKSLPIPENAFTHGPLGEYGHPHHQDTCFAVHQAFGEVTRVYSVAYNTYPDMKIELTQKEFALKTKILSKIYGSETNRFLNLLPATSNEGFIKLDLKEINSLYEYLTNTSKNKRLNSRYLKSYRWLSLYLGKHKSLPRPF